MSFPIDRRRFLSRTAAGLGALSAGVLISGAEPADPAAAPADAPNLELPRPAGPLDPYPADKPNVIVVRFGGGVRRRETVEFRDKTYCPFILHELAEKRGVLCSNVSIANDFVAENGVRDSCVTSHGQGTLYILTGQYDKYEDIAHQPLAERFVPHRPTIFEYLRPATTSANTRRSSSTARTVPTRSSTPSATTTSSASTTARPC